MDITLTNIKINTLTFQSTLFVSKSVHLATMQTPINNVLDALHFAKNALPTQCVLPATK